MKRAEMEFGELMAELAEINKEIEKGQGSEETAMRGGGWAERLQKWFDSVKEFAERNKIKNFEIKAEASMTPKIGITLTFEFF